MIPGIVDGGSIGVEFPMKVASGVLTTIANPKAVPESGEDHGPRKPADFPYLGPHKPENGRAGVGNGRYQQFGSARSIYL
jgi:hypothetical protein